MPVGTQQKQRFIGLEWLRFLMGMYVAVYHTAHMYFPEDGSLQWLRDATSMGFFATSTFFVLSGFLLAHVYFVDDRLREPAPSFWLKRLANLYPIHVFSLLLTIAVLLLMQYMAIPPDGAKASVRFVVFDTNEVLARQQPELFHHYMSNWELALNSALQLTLLHAWNPFYLTFNAPLWSISALFFFYLMFPIFGPRLMASKQPWKLLLLVGGLYLIPPLFVIWNQDYGIPYTGLIHRFPLFRLPEFLAGILAYSIFRYQSEASTLPGRPVRLALIAYVAVSFCTATVLFTSGPKFWYYLLHNGLLLPAQLILVYLTALIAEPRSASLKKWLPRLGAASLSIFVLHVPLSALFRTLEKLLMGDLPLCFSDWSACIAAAGRFENTLTGYFIFLALLIVASVLFQERLVTPTRKWIVAKLLPLVAKPSKPAS
ncbi:acyltransferase [Pseudomonas matsuisoli]|uniref:Acyltransferase n=1 Tax=Pseudomonas matsuisoli TaxID=1515666 RepID=A0A917PK80_9PSED|nr:acyltransferase [Pseudomonas matsuisoli]